MAANAPFKEPFVFCASRRRAYTEVVTDESDTPLPPSTEKLRPKDDFFAVDGSASVKRSDSEQETVILKAEPVDERPQSEIDTLITGGDDPNATVVEHGRLLGHVGRDLFEPVENIIGEHATRVERVRALVRDLDSNYLRVLLVVQGLSLISVAGIVSLIDIPDGFMYVMMEFLIGITLLRYIRTCVDEAGIRRWVVGALMIALSILWAGLLFNKVPPEPQWYAQNPEIRAELPLLWGPITGHIMVAVGLIFHLPLRRYLRMRR